MYNIKQHEHLYNMYDKDDNIICCHCGKDYNEEIKEQLEDI